MIKKRIIQESRERTAAVSSAPTPLGHHLRFSGANSLTSSTYNWSMGVWGSGIFADDNASDLREEYRKLIGDGVAGPAATDRLIEEWAPHKDTDLAPVFWIALAVTEWNCGRLEDR